MLETTGAEIAYDVRGPLPPADGRPPLFMIGQPMDASGFDTLASSFPDRTVVTYDPRGLGRSVRKDGRVDHAPTVQAEDVHAGRSRWARRPLTSGGASLAARAASIAGENRGVSVSRTDLLVVARGRMRVGCRDSTRSRSICTVATV
jgi:hypothetical protein